MGQSSRFMRGSTFAWLMVVVWTGTLAGCGVNLKSTKVSTTSAIRGEGIVYALPRTEFEVVQPAKITVSKSGAFADIFESCRRACDASRDASPLPGADESCDYDTNPQIVLAPAHLRSVTVPDRSRMYQVNPGADLFQSLDLKFDVAATGVIEEADVGGTNLAYEVVGSLAEAAIQAYMPASMFTRDTLENAMVKGKRNCYEVSTDVAAQVKANKAGTLQCPMLREMTTCMAPFEQDVIDARAKLDQLYTRAESKSWSSKVLLALVANQQEKVGLAKSRREEAAAFYALQERPERTATFDVEIPVGGPEEFKAFSKSVDLGPEVDAGTARLVGTSEEALSLRAPVWELLSKSTVRYSVAAEVPKDLTLLASESELGNGLHYRVPQVASVSLTAYASKAVGAKKLPTPVADKRMVAQYGAVASLPSRFKGKGGRVNVKHWPDSGGLQHVEIGAESVPTEAVTSVINKAVEVRQARREAKSAERDAEAGRDAEIDALARQLDVLELRRDIRAIEIELDEEDQP